ncbi:flavoprotein [Actinomycetes bacterium M1A6_2h]
MTLTDEQVDTPAFGAQRLLYVATGGIQAMFTPMWLQWFRTHYPEVELRYVMTRAATRFATPTALSVASGGAPSCVDEWPDQPDSALHVELASWPDAILVHPATMNFVARYSHGLGDTPALLALQCTTAPVVVCPSLPPGGSANPAYRRNIAELADRPNITVMAPVRGTSMTTGDTGIGTAAYLPHAVTALEELREWMVNSNG